MANWVPNQPPTPPRLATPLRYLAKLKEAALHLRLLHAQFHSDTKAALSSADVEAAVGRCAWA